MRYPAKLQKAFDQHTAHFEKCFRALVKYRKNAEKAGFNQLEDLANIAQFALILRYDLHIHGSDCEATRRRWRRNLYCRNIATSICESINDLSELCGKALQRSLPTVATDNILEKLRTTLKGLSAFRKSHSATLKKVRNSVSAHRDHDARKQFSTMENIDVDEILDLNADYITWLNDLFSVIDDTIVYSYKELQIRRKDS